MVAEERHEILGGEVQHLARWRGPDRRAHRREIVGQQARREVVLAKIFAQRQSGQFAGLVVFGALVVEGQDVAQHPQIRRRQQVSRLRKQSPGGLTPAIAAAFPLEAAGIRRDRKAHAAFHGLDAQMGEQLGQIGIVQFVVDDEADIDRQRCPVVVDGDGVAVSARPYLAFVDRDRIAFRQGPGRGIAGNSRSDHRDSHSCPRSLLCEIRGMAVEVSAGGSGGSRGFRESTDPGKTHEILVRLLRPTRIASTVKNPYEIRTTRRFMSAAGRRDVAGRASANRTVRHGIARLGCQSGSRGSITAVTVSQAVSTSVISESVGCLSRRRLPGVAPGGGRT